MFKKEHGVGIAIVLLIVGVVVAAIMCGKKTTTPLLTAQVLNNQSSQKVLEVLDCVYERTLEPGTFEHIVYFTFQEDADFFRFFINNELVLEGTIETLDLRYENPYRRAVLVTQERPNLPFSLSIIALNKSRTVVGKGVLNMTKMCYHDRN